MDKGQADRLIPLLEELLTEAGAGWRDLSAIGVGTGPGNFTGIRIAVSAARGLALALGKPAIGISAFEAMAHNLPRPLLATVDARRGAAYVQQLDHGAPLITTAEDLPSEYEGLACTGTLADVFAARTGGMVLPPAVPLAEGIAREALARLDQPGPRPAPLYLRAADALPPSDPPPVHLE